MEDRPESGFQSLADAIVVRAIYDHAEHKEETERFFNSKWCAVLCGVPAEDLIVMAQRLEGMNDY